MEFNAEDAFDLTDAPTSDNEKPHLSWKEKHDLMERQISQFRKQAGKVRELLAKKMKEYESRVLLAEKKRDETQDKVEKLEIACQDKDEAISALREKIYRMREERSSFISLDDDKMTKIKEWVKTKLTELLRELELVKRERDGLQAQCDQEGAGRVSGFSVSSKISNYYEEIFGELMDDLRPRPASYESLSSYQVDGSKDKRSMDVSPLSLKNNIEPPIIPPRRSSIRDNNRPVNRQINLCAGGRRSSSPQFINELYNLPEENRRHDTSMGSLNALNEEVLLMSQEEVPNRRLTEDEDGRDPVSPFYYSLQATQNGMEFDFDREQNVAPVYSTLRKIPGNSLAKPRIASIIRETPFSGTSTDSDADSDENSGRRNSVIRSVASSEPDNRPLKTCAPYTAQNMRAETLEKAGWLTKMGGRVKNWKKRWFVLFDGRLNYFKNRSDMYGKPLGWVQLDQIRQISKSERLLTFQLVTPNRTFYLTADSTAEVDDWLRVLRTAMRRFSGARLMSRASEKTIYSGWVTKAKYGNSRHCWAVLMEKSLLFYKTDIEQAPVSVISLREIVAVTPVEDDSVPLDSEYIEEDGSCRLMVECLKDTHPTYLIIGSRSEMELWLHHLQHMCSGVDMNSETDLEQIVTKLMNIDGDSGSRYWRSKIMIHSKNLIKESLTSLPTAALEKEAINLWKSVQLFSTTPINETAIDYHLISAQDIIQQCLTHPELQTEVYCQLIKQTSKYRSSPSMNGATSFNSSDWVISERSETYDCTIDMNPVSSFVYMQCWQLLALCTSIFLPKLKILWLLKAHLHRNANESSDVGRYAIYCQRSLEQTLKNGERETRPSRIEALALIARNPYYRIYPMSIPVYFVNNSYQLFSFDGSTTVAEFTHRVNEETGIRSNSESGYALFTDNPVANVEHCLPGELKICDVISKWEQAAQHLKTGRFERSKAIKLTYKCRLFFKSSAKLQTDKEKFLSIYQFNESLHLGHLLPTTQAISKLTALLAQIDIGDYVDHFNVLEDVHKIYPNYSSIQQPAIKRKVFRNIADIWSGLKGKEVKECVNSYLRIVQTIPLYGCKLFKAQEKLQQISDKENQANVWISIEEEKIQILSHNMELINTYLWPNVITFGGFKEDFMLVVQVDEDDPETTSRHLFAMPPGRVLEVTFLIASYVNAVVTKCGLNLDAKGYAVKATSNILMPDNIHLWDMESEG